MQTLQFTRGLQQIVFKLKANEIVTFLTPYLTGPQPTPIQQAAKDKFSTLLIQASNGFAELASDPEIKRILDTLKVADVYAVPRIGKLITTFGAAATSQNIWGVTESYHLFYSFVVMLTWLDQLSSSCTSLLETERVNRTLPGTATVELEIIDDGTTGVDAERVRRFFTSLIELHSQLARFLKVEGAHLEIVYMDSGSILVGFATAVGIAATLQKLLREIWNEVKYGPFERLDRKMDSLGKVLTVTKEIEEQIQSKVLSEEDGKNLKHRILAEAFALIEVGAMLPADNAAEEKEQRKLLTERRQKLLGKGDGPPVDAPANKG
jgi:hypothetical protein